MVIIANLHREHRNGAATLPRSKSGQDRTMRIRLATFNIENLGRRNGSRPDIETRRPTLQAQLRRVDADILCLQEVNAQEGGAGSARQLRDLDTVLAGAGPAGVPPPPPPWQGPARALA